METTLPTSRINTCKALSFLSTNSNYNNRRSHNTLSHTVRRSTRASPNPSLSLSPRIRRMCSRCAITPIVHSSQPHHGPPSMIRPTNGQMLRLRSSLLPMAVSTNPILSNSCARHWPALGKSKKRPQRKDQTRRGAFHRLYKNSLGMLSVLPAIPHALL